MQTLISLNKKYIKLTNNYLFKEIYFKDNAQVYASSIRERCFVCFSGEKGDEDS